MVKVSAVGKARAKIISHEFPTEAVQGVYKNWSSKVQNIGDGEGYIAFVIVNSNGNPGSITVKYDTTEKTLEPGYYIRFASANPIPPNSTISVSGSVKFNKAGSYDIRLLGQHQEDSIWFTDDEIAKDG